MLRRLIGIAMLVVIGLTCLTALRRVRAAPDDRRLLDAAWQQVDEHYYDGTFNGYDWPAVLATYERKLSKGDTSNVDVESLIAAMLNLLETSHLTVYRDTNFQRASASKSSGDKPSPETFGIIIPESRLATGVTIALTDTSKLQVVLDLSPQSVLRQAGIVPGDRFIIQGSAVNRDQSPSVFIIKRDGSTRTIPLRSAWRIGATDHEAFGNRSFDYVLDSLDDVSLKQMGAYAVARRKASATVLYRPLGVVTTLGRITGMKVIDIEPGSPAAKANFALGADVVSVEGTRSTGQTITVINPDKTRRRVHGAFPATHPADLNDPPSVQRSGRCKIVSFGHFDDENAAWLSRELTAKDFGAVIVDLRRNDGGNADAMQRVAGLFLPPQTLLGTDHGRDKLERLYTPAQAQTMQPVPVWVLIGPGTASAAEIIAAAIRNAHRGTLVGRRTAGAVLRAKSYPLLDGYRIQIPIASFSDSRGRFLESHGVDPDIVSVSSQRDLTSGIDRPLLTALNAARCPARHSIRPWPTTNMMARKDAGR